MVNKLEIRVALCQRICPDFRVPVWEMLSNIPGIDLTLFYGAGSGKGSSAGSERKLPFKSHLLSTIPIDIKKKYRVLHPRLVPAVLAGNFDVVISEGLTYFPNSLLLAFSCSIKGIPFIMYEAPPVGEETLFRKIQSPLYRCFASWIITYTSWGKKYYVDKGFPEDRITVALNTIDTVSVLRKLELFLPERESLMRTHHLDGHLVVGYIGAIEERKHPDILLKSVIKLVEEKLPVKALFIGDGPFKEELEKMIPSHMKGSVIMVGRHIDDAERYLQLCSVLVLPAQGGLAVPHVLTCGIPCIATENAEGPGIREYIEDGVNGWILKGDIQIELTRRLRDLSNNQRKLDLLKKGALDSRERFNVTEMVRSIAETIKSAHSNLFAEDKR